MKSGPGDFRLLWLRVQLAVVDATFEARPAWAMTMAWRRNFGQMAVSDR